jgi:hypothetical protein
MTQLVTNKHSGSFGDTGGCEKLLMPRQQPSDVRETVYYISQEERRRSIF